MYEDRKPDRMSFDTGSGGFGSDGQQNGSGYTYSYEPQNGGNGWRPEKPPRRNGPAIPILTVILCVLLSFGAGVGGATMAYNSIVRNAQNGNSVPAPDSGTVLNKDPSSLLDRSEAEFSPYGSAGEDAYSISSVARMVQDAVVVINATSGRSTSAGSGVIISDKGYILTCNHVVEGATKISVTVNNCANPYLAATVGTDSGTDLAVLKIEPLESEPLTAATHGISENLVVGEHVVAIGNPLGTLGGTVTDGIISAKARQVKTDNGTMTLLQTNAAINSGNSGGGLFNLKGELIGIVNAKYAESGVEGLAFAIPIDTAYEVEKDLIQYGYVQGVPDIGISLVEVNQSNYRYYWRYPDVSSYGLYVVSSKNCAELKNRDRILTVNGTAVTTEAEYEAAVADLKAGDTLTLTYTRGSSGEEKTVSFVIPQYVPENLTSRTNVQFTD
ncbi:MAG TPA: serine protease HtrA [Clostridiales bacterium]|nr:serine protease HtrA [Clostridiales bacterium]